MAALTSLFMLALQAPLLGDLPGANRTEAVEALTQAHIAVGQVGHCTEELPGRSDLEETYGHLYQRFHDASEEAEELYPGAYTISEMLNRTADTVPRCDDVSLDAYVAQAQRQLGIAEALISADMEPRRRGLWLGPLRLCGERVEGVEPGEPQFQGDSPRANIGLSPGFAPRVEALTAAFVARTLSIVLDGMTLSRPRVNEPVSFAISVSLPDGVTVEQVRRAAALPC